MSASAVDLAVLAARARRLARPLVTDADEGLEMLELLRVQVGDEELAIPLAAIASIARVGPIAPLPRAVAPVYGVTAWRGRPITVLSLAAGRLHTTADSRLVVLGSAARAVLAVVVDAVHDADRVARASLSAAGAGPRRAYALGVTPDALLVVNPDALLHPELLAP